MSSVRSSAGARRPAAAAARGGRPRASIASVAEPPLPSASSRPPRVERGAQLAAAAASSASPPSASVCARSAPTSSAFISTERARRRRRPPRGRAPARRGTDRGSSTRRVSCTGAGVAALEQAAVVEEHVHELPQHVVERLDELLARRRGRRVGGSNSHSAPGRARRRRSGSRARARRRAPPRHRSSPEARSRCRPGSHTQLEPAPPSGAALAGQAERRQRALADDHRVHELDRHVARVRARRRRGGRARPAGRRAAKRSAIRWHSRAMPLGLGAEEALVRPRRAREQLVDRADAPVAERRRAAHAAAPARAGDRARATRGTPRRPRRCAR